MKNDKIKRFEGEWGETTIESQFDIFVGGDVDFNDYSPTKSSTHQYPIFGNALIDKGLYGYSSKPKYKGNSITITGRGAVGVAMYRKDDFSAIVRLLVLIPKSPNVTDSLFVSYYFKQHAKFPQENTGVPQLTAPQIKNTALKLPSLPEQTAIATVLSDTDHLINSLEKLISKKQAIKKGAMQELLTGKKRLPGFSGEWVEMKLVDIALNIKTGECNNEDKEENGKYPFFVRSQQIERINHYSHDCEAIIIPGEGKIGQIFHYINGKFNYHQRVYKISDFNNVDGKFVFFYMSMFFGEYALMNSVKATVDSLRLPTFQNFDIYIPKNKLEQTAIATVLSDMDTEIEKLTTKLNKLKDIKQGMMSELLTGRIRLPKPEQIQSFKPSISHNETIENMVLLAGVINAFYHPKYALGRKKVQKLLYLLFRHLGKNLAHFKEKTFGPYDNFFRYNIEQNAEKSKYIISKSDKKSTMFEKGEKIQQALYYINKWGYHDSFGWLYDSFKFKNVDDLEVLATVDWAMTKLRDKDIDISVSTVKDYIENSREWKDKLKRDIFSDQSIKKAIEWSEELFG